MQKPIRALLLSAGLGTRLRPYTNTTPKCLIKVGGKPLLQYWFEALEKVGCKEILINTHYLYQQVEDFVLAWDSDRILIKTVFEEQLLGTAATLLANRSFFKDGTGLLIHADNITNTNLNDLLFAHDTREQNCLLTMLTFKTNTPSNCGIVQTNIKGVVKAFYEKKKKPPGNIANGAVYAFDLDFFSWLDTINIDCRDFSTEVLPLLIGRIQTWQTHLPYIDIGTPEALEKANSLTWDN